MYCMVHGWTVFEMHQSARLWSNMCSTVHKACTHDSSKAMTAHPANWSAASPARTAPVRMPQGSRLYTQPLPEDFAANGC